MDLVVRPVTDAEYPDYGKCMALAFGVDYDAEKQAQERQLIPIEDTLGAFDGDLLVGTEAAFRMTLAIPGARVPMAGVTSVAVRPTHHRRGILTAIMRARLDGMRDRGEWLAGLWASETVIYGRFGYGVATERLALDVDTARSAFRGPRVEGGEVRLVEKDQALEAIPPIYERATADWPGAVARDAAWWRHLWLDPKDDRAGRSALLFAVHSSDGEDDGFAVYRTKLSWQAGTRSEVLVEDIVPAGDASCAGLWRYLLDLDLMPHLLADRRPVDEPLAWMLHNRRALQARRSEALWLRLVDVPAALLARRYLGEGSLVLEVADDFCPWNGGRYRLTCGPDGASCERTSDAAQLTLETAQLASAYLGGVSIFTLLRAGLVREDVPGAAARADSLLRWHRQPWCDRVF
jgi:predicted acetyltransferase